MISFVKLKIVQAAILMLLPLILICVSGEVAKSISAYVDIAPITFACTLTFAVCLFINDGFTEVNHRYNKYIGLALFGVIVFHHEQYPIIHYIFAIIFFIGNLFNMVFFSSNKERWFKIIIAIGILIGMSGCFIFNLYSIFWAEWLGLTPIGIHFILERLDKID